MKWTLVLVLAWWASLPMAAAADESDDALRAADASWNALRMESAVQGLAALLVDDWVLTHSDGRVQDKAEYLGELSTRTRTNQAIENQDVQVRRHGDLLAVVTGTSVQAGSSNGLPWSGRFRFTRTWIKREGRWQMAASHSSRIAAQP